jgi:hypothetical protein
VPTKALLSTLCDVFFLKFTLMALTISKSFAHRENLLRPESARDVWSRRISELSQTPKVNRFRGGIREASSARPRPTQPVALLSLSASWLFKFH